MTHLDDNRIVANTKDGLYSYKVTVDSKVETRCQKMNLRFMGLFDTVLSTNRSDHAYNLAIPDQFAYVAHAVALNEYRGRPCAVGAFPLESIMQGMSSPTPKEGQVRIELGFLGAHADIGGGVGRNENELAQVALSWMVQQAKTAGVKMTDPRSDIKAKPVVHDKSDNQYVSGKPVAFFPHAMLFLRMPASITTARRMKWNSKEDGGIWARRSGASC